MVYHIPVSKRATHNGYPDNHYIHRTQPWHLHAELKRHDGMLSDDQVFMLERLHACGLPCYVWVADKLYQRPLVWEEVNRILQAGPGATSEPTRWPWVLIHWPKLVTAATRVRVLGAAGIHLSDAGQGVDESPTG